jgi:hypothetical protein
MSSAFFAIASFVCRISIIRCSTSRRKSTAFPSFSVFEICQERLFQSELLWFTSKC